MSGVTAKAEISFYKRFQKRSQESTDVLTHQERGARDTAFNSSPGMAHLDGWMFNIAWDAARDYYLSPAGRTISSEILLNQNSMI